MLAANPREMRAVYSLAVIDLRQGDYDKARRGFRAFARAQPGNFAARHNLGVAAQALGHWTEAARAYGEALAMDPLAAESRFALARAVTILGRAAEAVAHYRELALSPVHRLRALTLMGVLAPKAADETELEALCEAAWNAAIDVEARTGAFFALGPVLEARGDTEAAFAAFAEGNRLKRETLGERAVAAARLHARSVAIQKARFTAAFAASRDAAASRSNAPIFIVGFPRSGSSLIEQILASHPDVQGMGETGLFGEALARGGGADAYLKAIRQVGWRSRIRFVDKTLENYIHVGEISRLLPKAVVIHASREATDACLACWRQLFSNGGETLYDLAEIGDEYRRVQEMIGHWGAVLPGRLSEVSLETLVASPEAEIRRLVVEVCGLRWNSACLTFWRTPGAVRTASAAQVRRPISADGLGRWRAYAHHLGPLEVALSGARRRQSGPVPGLGP